MRFLGVPATLDREGNKLRSKIDVIVQIEYNNYYPSRTHPSHVLFDIVPETKIKTEIIKNSK